MTDELPPASPYQPPVDETLLALEVAGLPGLLELGHFRDVDPTVVAEAVREFARFAAEVIAPTDRAGDVVGARLSAGAGGGTVVVPEPIAAAYRRYVEAGWGALQFPARYGGGGLPGVVGLALQEIFAAANCALSLNPVLTQGAIELLLAWGSEEQRGRYVPRLLTGEWTGTMNLTEPEAGSDLGAVATLARPQGDGSWSVTGTKIFITWGEHELAGNIVHLVLARTPDAAPGTKGLSLFLVPKRLLGADGEPGAPNALRCVRLEDKLGLHASPTCVMSFEGARAELVGPLGGGMHAMFTMMNRARLSIGAEGPGIAERAYQHALAYALQRRQGRASGVTPPARSLIVEHPDVRRMLIEMRVLTLAARMLLYRAAACSDRALHGDDARDAGRAQAMVDLLTPVAKAWSTDCGVAAASLGVQVLGGMGYIEESGMPQRLRDARIAPIYEGTNGIQAIDLVTRKLPRDGAQAVRELLAVIGELVKTAGDGDGGPALAPTVEALREAHQAFEGATEWLLGRLADRPDDALAGASAYLELFGVTVGGSLMLERALAARRLEGDRSGSRATSAAAESNAYAALVLGRAAGIARTVTVGSATLAAAMPAGAAATAS